MTNGIPADALVSGIGSFTIQRAFQRHTRETDERLRKGEDAAHPSLMGYGMVLNARAGTVYGDVRRVDPATVAKRRARNKAARKARRIGRNR